MASSEDVPERLRAALADRYLIERKIGSGGMAHVYLAGDLRHLRQVAVKVLRPELAAVLGLQRFLKEIQVTASLQHPHILPLFDSGEADGFLFFVMPFVAGETLRERLLRETPLPVDEALKIASEVADALGSAHTRGVVHRDIKPENILLADGHALVADFGIGLAVKEAGGDRLTATGLSLGTPAYMSPEQVSGEQEIDARADIYSLACVLYEMLVGEPPFTGPTSQVVMARHLAAPVPSITTARSSVPQPVAAAITKALGKTPADRHASASAFREALVAQVAEPEAKSIAVLPFSNMSADPENEYFSDGITEEIINALTKLRDLRVAARTSSFTFKGKTPDIREVGARLQVATVLEGSVRKAGNRLRITAQLINVADGYHLWSERYDREMTDVFAIQDEIAAAVVEKLKVSLLGTPEAGVRSRHTDDLAAYELYLRGRHLWNQRGAGMRKGLAYFLQAVERDPEYALAHAGIADAYALIGFWSGTKGRDAFLKGKAAAQRALELDPLLAEAHACLGFIAMYHDWDWPLAEGELLRAIELNPRYVGAHLFYAQYLGWTKGDGDAAVQQLRYAHELDPLSVPVLAQLGGQLVNAGRLEEGLAELDRTLELAPSFVNAHWFRSMACRQLSRHEESIEILTQAVTLNRGELTLVGELALTYAEAGHIEEAQEILDAGVLCDAHPAYGVLIHAAMGRSDAAFEWLEKAYDQRDPILQGLHRYPGLRLDQADPRFEDLVRRLALP